jgi:hypothetical protein
MSKKAKPNPYRCLHCHAINAPKSIQCYLCRRTHFYLDQVANDNPDKKRVGNADNSSLDDDSDEAQEPWDSPEEFEAMQNRSGVSSYENQISKNLTESNQYQTESSSIKVFQSFLFLITLAIGLVSVIGTQPAAVIMTIVLVIFMLANISTSNESTYESAQQDTNPDDEKHFTSKLGTPDQQPQKTDLITIFIQVLAALILLSFMSIFAVLISFLMMCGAMLN